MLPINNENTSVILNKAQNVHQYIYSTKLRLHNVASSWKYCCTFTFVKTRGTYRVDMYHFPRLYRGVKAICIPYAEHTLFYGITYPTAST